jgi:hypothetical protein
MSTPSAPIKVGQLNPGDCFRYRKRYYTVPIAGIQATLGKPGKKVAFAGKPKKVEERLVKKTYLFPNETPVEWIPQP